MHLSYQERVEIYRGICGGLSKRQIAKIQKGEASLTLASLAYLSALLGTEPTLTFKKRS